MNMFSYIKKTKKFILVLVLLLLFNFCYPKTTMAATGWFDLKGGFSSLFFFLERGAFGLLNNLFCDDKNDFIYSIGDTINGVTKVDIRLRLTPENIIKGKFLLFNANIFENVKGVENDDPDRYYDDGSDKDVVEGRESLRNIIAGWYYALRNFAIVALLSVLVYVGIRMIISTIAQDKAKYKTMFKDWLIALCLLIAMHYMMILILNISSQIVNAIGTSGNAKSQTEEYMVKIANINESDKEKDITEDGRTYPDVRYTDPNGEHYTIGDAFAYEFLLLAILYYTVLFTVKYLKREFTIIFLILLGPISCITYPIDKISDGKSQAFNKWFSEFLFNVIIQPFHLLIYIVLVGSASQLANDNIIYSIICFAVMIPAEKFIREMFGFRDKLGSPLGAFAGGAVASQLFNKMRGGGSSKSNKDDTSKESTDLPVKTKSTSDLIGTGEGDDARIGAGEGGNAGIGVGDGGNAGIGTGESDDAETGTGEGDDAETGAGEGENAGIGAGEGGNAGIGAGEDEGEKVKKPDNQQSQGRWARGLSAMRDRYDRKLLRKYGTTDKGQLLKKRAWRATKGLGRLAGKTIRGATTLAGTAALGTLGIMTGQGGKGALAGAALGSVLGKKVTQNSLVSKTGEYAKEFHKGFTNKNTNKERFKTNVANIDRARRNFKDRNKRLGTAEEINQELEGMYKMQQYGVNDALLDDAMDIYRKNQETMDNTQALDEAIIAANMMQPYSQKDMRNSDVMHGVQEDYVQRYMKNAGLGEADARAKVRKLMVDGASLKGVQNVALPGSNQTIDVELPSTQDIASVLQIEHPERMTQTQIDRVHNVNIRLRRAGLNKAEIQHVAAAAASGDASADIIDRYEMQVEYLNDAKAQDLAKAHIEMQNGGKNASAKQLKAEMKERLILRSTFDVKDEKEISAIRELEGTELRNEKSQIQTARDFAIQHKGQMRDEAHMTSAREELVEKLIAGGSSTEKATKDADNIINMARNYNNE